MPMPFSSRYDRVPTSPILSSEKEESPRESSNRPTRVQLSFWILLFVVSLAGSREVVVLLRRAHVQSSPTWTPAHPEFAPLGTLWSFVDPYLKPNTSDVSTPVVDRYEADRDALLFHNPTAIGLMQRSHPDRSYYDVSEHAAKKILLNDITAAIFHFDNLEASKELCAIALRPGMDNQTLDLRGAQHHAQVWTVSLGGAPFDPSTISYKHRPPRQHYMGDLEFGTDQISATGAFRCPESGASTILLQCMQPQFCWIEWMQSLDSGNNGVQLVQWSDE